MGMVIMMQGGFWVHRAIDVDKPLFRCMKLQHVADLIENNRLFFNQVLRWDDTWEIPTRFYKTELDDILSLKIKNTNFVADTLYGTCWTNIETSDALWRIYSGVEKDGVCIQTTVRKLFESIDFSQLTNNCVDGFVAPIRYENLGNTPNMEVFKDDEAETYPRNMMPAFIKRNAFSHESEIRFLVHAARGKNGYPGNPLNIAIDGSHMYLPLKNTDFIDQLILDPRLTQEEFKYKSKCHQYLGKPIIKSTLYDTPDRIFEIVHSSGAKDWVSLKGARRWSYGDFRKIGNDT